MLDFDLINSMYPKAFGNYVSWLNEKIPNNSRQIYFQESYLYFDKGNCTKLFSNNVRDLYDYFDEYNITVEIFKEQVLGDKKHSERWCFDVGLIISKGYTTRRLAEGAAFKQAFSLLDKRL